MSAEIAVGAFRPADLAAGRAPIRCDADRGECWDPSQAGGQAAVFLDRDGVMIAEVHYLSDPDQVRLLPGSGQAIAELNAAGVPVVVVTNQAGVAHGYFPESRIGEVHQRVDELLTAEGASVDRYDYCPHHPTAEIAPYRVQCDCRKPAPGMLLRAAHELGLNLSHCYLVGDKLSDIEASLRAGCRPILVRTGYGSSVAKFFPQGEPGAVEVAADLAAAVRLCLPVLANLH